MDEGGLYAFVFDIRAALAYIYGSFLSAIVLLIPADILHV